MTDAPTDPRLVEAQIRQAEATASYYQSQERLNAVKIREAEADAAQAEFVVRTSQREEASLLAQDDWHHVYTFDEAVSGSSVAEAMHVLTEWSRKEPGCPIEIRFNSPGGSVIDGMAFWDFLMSLKRDGHHLTTVAIGYAASMAGILLQAGDTRVMYAESWLMIHEVSFGARGKIGDIEDTVEWVKKIQARVIDIFAERSRLSKAQIKRNWARKDWWLDARESLRDGFIDEIR